MRFKRRTTDRPRALERYFSVRYHRWTALERRFSVRCHCPKALDVPTRSKLTINTALKREGLVFGYELDAFGTVHGERWISLNSLVVALRTLGRLGIDNRGWEKFPGLVRPGASFRVDFVPLGGLDGVLDTRLYTPGYPLTGPSADLARASGTFAALATLTVSDVHRAYHEAGAAILTLCVALDRAEAEGLSCAAMRELLGEARDIHALSPFVRRLQTWPRGYPGDFETIEHLMSQDNRAIPNSVGFAIEQYCLATALAQQHRNKMRRQADEVLRAIIQSEATRAPRILILAAGASPELRLVANMLGSRDFRAVICDTDPGAIEFSKTALRSLGDRVVALEGDVIWCADEIEEQGPYDLVVAGGLFDYLDDKWAKKTLAPVLNDWLVPGGKLFFTNLATQNPFRLWMRCLVDWNVIERTEHDLAELVGSVRTTGISIEMERDSTTLALMASVRCDV